jgi:murein DD-endopeptidase MepM/ murein hydrolase activator NlpD
MATRGRLFSSWLAAVALLAMVAPAAVSPQEPGALALEISRRARALHPGEVVLLRVSAPQTVEIVYGAAFDRSVHFFAADEPGIWHGLLGIDVDTPPGEYEVAVRALAAGGAAGALVQSLRVDPKDFATRRLTVDAAFVDPPAAVLARIQREQEHLAEVYSRLTSERLWRGAFHAPVPGPPTSSFGRLSVFNGEPRSRHRGTDFRAATGTPVKAPAAGRVALSADLYFAGGSVVLDHGWGLFSQFAHLSRRDVQEGDLVEAGQVIGRVGATGRVTGPHLHWSVRIGSASVDPLSLLAILQ